MLTQHYKPNIPASFFCTSSDTKPTDCENGSMLHEIDTGKVYRFDAENLVWHEKQNSAAPSDAYTRDQTDSLLAAKVDRVAGKQLSTEDYTSADKSKLEGIESGANHTDVDATLSYISTNPVQNKVVSDALDLKADESDLGDHIADTNNPHATTKAQVGLGNADNTSDADKPISTATQAALDAKQDTIQDLSTIRSGAVAGATALQPSDVSSTYSATGTAPVNGTAIAAAIGSLDAASAGGSGKYIASISETNGKISAVEGTIDTTPTADSANPVTSGGVKTALDGKQDSISDLASIRSGAAAGATAVQPTEFQTDQGRQDALEAEDRAALVELVDGGAKNLLDIEDSSAIDYNATHTVVDDALIISGTSSYARVAYPVTLKKGKYKFIATVDAISEDARIRFNTASAGSGDSIAPDISITNTGNCSTTIELAADTSFYIMFYSRISSGSSASSAQFSKIMLCAEAAWDISQAYVPYRPSYDDLIARIEALESGTTRSVSTLATLSKSAAVDDSEDLADYADDTTDTDEENNTAVEDEEVR